MKYRMLFLCLLVTLLGVTACQPLRMSGPAPAPKPSGAHIALALPKTGPYAGITGKITRGAQLAAQELKTGSNAQVTLHIIDTMSPKWTAQIKALPESCVMVGGPLYGGAYAAARQAGLLEQRAFFAFLPSLEDGDEGKRAWRYFPSAQDQIDALIGFATSNGINSFGAFYPGDQYSRHMVGLFEQQLARKNLTLEKAQYTSGAQSTWPTAAAQLVKPTQTEDNSTPLPNTGFEALFVPGPWKDMSHIMTSLIFNGEERLVLLGTTSWEQSLSGKRLLDASRYQLAVFPGAWSSAMAPKALRGSNNDFWVALGYSYVRFAYQMNLTTRPAAENITALARARSYTVSGLGAISWDTSGIAHQKLFLFQPSASGIQKADPAQVRAVRAAARERLELRKQGLPVVDAQGNALVPGLAPSQPAPGTIQGITPAQQPTIGTRPLPSYKLRLPSNVQ